MIFLIMPMPWFCFYFKSVKVNEEFILIRRVNDILYSLMFVRFFYIFKLLITKSIYQDAYSKMIARKHGFESNVRFTMKCCLIQYPATTFIVCFVTSVLFFSYLIRIYEMPYYVYES